MRTLRTGRTPALRSTRLPPWPWLAAGAALFTGYLTLALASPTSVGFWGDDAVYVSTAQSLARGTGYRHAEIASQPLQTKYPILYPALLALVFLIEPDYPRNVPLMLAWNALAAAVMAPLAALYWRRVFGASVRLAVALGALVAIAPTVLAFIRYPMSELVYAALALGALFCFDARYARAPSRPGAIAWLVAAALLAGLAALTRTLGLSLAAALTVAPLLRRRWFDAALVAALLALCLAPWWLWQAGAAEENAALQTAFLEAYELDYGLWLPERAGQLLDVAVRNLVGTAFALGFFQLALPRGLFEWAFAGPWVATAALHLVCDLALLLVVLGFAASLRAGPRALHLYAIAYAAIVLTWPFPPYRFLVPWTPFLLYFLAEGLRTGLRAIAARSPGEVATRVWRAGAAASWLLLAALFLAEGARIAASTPRDFYAREARLDLTEAQALAEWIRAHTEESDVIASWRPAQLYLASGRRGFNTWAEADPYAARFSPDRRLGTFYAIPSPVDDPAAYGEMREKLPRVYAAAGVTVYVEHALDPRRRELARLVREHPGWFELRYTSRNRTLRVYRLKLPAAPAPGPQRPESAREADGHKADRSCPSP